MFQPIFACSKSAIETQEKSVENVEVAIVSLLLTLNIFSTFSSVSIVNVEHGMYLFGCWVYVPMELGSF